MKNIKIIAVVCLFILTFISNSESNETKQKDIKHIQIAKKDNNLLYKASIKSEQLKFDFKNTQHFKSYQNIKFEANGISIQRDKSVAVLLSKIIKNPIESPDPFLSVSIQWNGELFSDSKIEIKIRTSKNSRLWGDWQQIKPDDEIINNKYFRSIYFDKSTGFMQYQITLIKSTENYSPKINSLMIHFLSPGATPKRIQEEIIRKYSPKELDLEKVAIESEIPYPVVVSRYNWGCPSPAGPGWNYDTDYTVATHLIVHHTDSDNTSTDWAAVVRFIYDLHVNTWDWKDIGYNYLIDPNGIIYEGRSGGHIIQGDDQVENIIGSHFSGMNSNTFGVALLGTFTTDTPTAAALASLTAFLAWRCDYNSNPAGNGYFDINPLGITFHGSSGLNLNNISGHRDSGVPTLCPGNNLYGWLPTIRITVNDYYNIFHQSPTALGILALQNNTITNSVTYEALSTIFVGPNYIVQNGGNLTLIAGRDIFLNPGFDSQTGSTFDSYINPNLNPKTELLAVLNLKQKYQALIDEFHEKNRLNINNEITLTKEGKNELVPDKFHLYQNYPNPFNPVTSIPYDLPEDSHVKINVYNLNGRLVENLINRFKSAGQYKVSFNGDDLSSGVYIYEMVAGNYRAVKKMMLVK